MKIAIDVSHRFITTNGEQYHVHSAYTQRSRYLDSLRGGSEDEEAEDLSELLHSHIGG